MVVKRGMCGNGIRCLAKFLYEKELIKETRFFIETNSGKKEIELILENKTVIGVKVGMGEVISEGKLIIRINEETFEGYKMNVRKSSFCLFC